MMMMEMLGRTGGIYCSERRATAPTGRPLDLIRELPVELDNDPKSCVRGQHAAKSLKSLCCQRWSLGG